VTQIGLSTKHLFKRERDHPSAPGAAATSREWRSFVKSSSVSNSLRGEERREEGEEEVRRMDERRVFPKNLQTVLRRVDAFARVYEMFREENIREHLGK
jgi:hypothetical protein